VRLTQKGRNTRDLVRDLFHRHATDIDARALLGADGLPQLTASLYRMERYWADQIRYIY
jgi:hypothetical protein